MCKTLEHLNRNGLHKGGCHYAKTCTGETCYLPSVQEAVATLTPDVNTPEDYKQAAATAQALAEYIKRLF